MAQYLAYRISVGALDYKSVIEKKPDLKQQIDQILVESGFENLIVWNTSEK